MIFVKIKIMFLATIKVYSVDEINEVEMWLNSFNDAVEYAKAFFTDPAKVEITSFTGFRFIKKSINLNKNQKS